MLKRLYVFVTALLASAVIVGNEAMAEQFRSTPWQMGFQEPRSPSAERIFAFHDLLLWIEGAIVVFVLALMIYIIIKFNAKSNPVPSTTTHNTLLEVVWTVVPILILVFISVPSLKLLYFTDRTANPELTIKVTGNQWYWTYEYPDNNEITIAKTSFETFKKFNPTIIIKVWYTYVYLPYIDENTKNRSLMLEKPHLIYFCP